MISRARPYAKARAWPQRTHATAGSVEPWPPRGPCPSPEAGTHPADQMTTCEVHAARSNEIKPLNLVDQWSRGCGKALDCFLCLMGHIRGYPPGPIAAEFRLLPP